MIIHRVLVALIIAAICLSFLVPPIDATTEELDGSKNKAKRIATYLLSSIFPQTGEEFSNTNYGVEIKYPKNWTGFEMKVILPMAIVSPNGFNITDLFSKYIDSSLDNMAESTESIVSNNGTELSEQDIQKLIEPKIQESAEALSKNLMEHMENKTTRMSIFIYDKELVGFINSVIPNSTESVDSLTSLYERLVDASNSTITCDRITSNQTILNSNISAEVSTEKCLFTDSNRYQDNLNYFVLTPRAIVGIQYTSDSNNQNDKFLPQFEESLKSLSVRESLPISNQSIKQFLNDEINNNSDSSKVGDTGQNILDILNGTELISQGNYEEAINSYDLTLSVDPNNMDALYSKGVALHYLGRYDEAISSYDKVLALDPKYANALYGKGAALANLAKDEEAISWYDKTLAADPKNVDALNGKGLALGKIGRMDEAITSLDKALEINPGYFTTLINKGVMLGSLGKYEEAIIWVNKGLEINPEDDNALALRAKLIELK